MGSLNICYQNEGVNESMVVKEKAFQNNKDKTNNGWEEIKVWGKVEIEGKHIAAQNHTVSAAG